MKKRLVAALIGVGAGGLAVGAYYAASQTGIHLRPEMVVAAAAVLAFASAVSVFALVAMDRPSYSGARATLLLNEEPATGFIFSFKGPNTAPILARPDMSVGEMLVRYGDAFRNPPDQMTKAIVLTLKGSSKKPFASITLQQLFLTLKPFHLEHVLLTNERGDFIGYIPGKRASKEFTGDKAVESIDKFIVKILENPSDSAKLREIGGANSDDTVAETDNTQSAEAKIWANDNVQGLVIHHKLKPAGFISKVDVLRLNVGRL
jgi:hypothetical protein